jgi:hypothetical protein
MASFAVPNALVLSSRKSQPLDADTGSTADAASQTAQPAFITTQTLASFSGASAVATFLWKVLAGFAGGWADKRWVPLAICGVIGVYLTLVAFNNAKKFSDYFGAVVVGAVNTVQLWVAVIGFDVVLDTTTGIDQTGGST